MSRVIRYTLLLIMSVLFSIACFLGGAIIAERSVENANDYPRYNRVTDFSR